MDTRFRTKPQLALAMLTDLVTEGSLPVHWVTCAEGFCVSSAFLDGGVGLGLGYLAEVACNAHVWAHPEQGGSPSLPVFSAPSEEVALWPANSRPRPDGLSSCDRGPGPGDPRCLVLCVTARCSLFPGPDV